MRLTIGQDAKFGRSPDHLRLLLFVIDVGTRNKMSSPFTFVVFSHQTNFIRTEIDRPLPFVALVTFLSCHDPCVTDKELHAVKGERVSRTISGGGRPV